MCSFSARYLLELLLRLVCGIAVFSCLGSEPGFAHSGLVARLVGDGTSRMRLRAEFVAREQPAPLPPPSQVAAEIADYRRLHEDEIIYELNSLLAIPNTANDEPNIQRNAALLVEMLRRRGFQTQLLPIAGRGPIVLGQLNTTGAERRLIFYCHYDGQPVEASGWTGTKPFGPALRTDSIEAGGRLIPFPTAADAYRDEWRIYARSSADDKAPIVAVLAALDALKGSNIPVAVNVKLVLDSEEEAGSPHLEQTLLRYKQPLTGDLLICADGPIHQSGGQQINFGNRGVIEIKLTVYGPIRPLHRGHYGNWAPNPAMRLAQLLATMKDTTGRVLIRGFYDDVAPLGPTDKQALQAAPAHDFELRKEFGIGEPDGNGETLLQLVTEPSLNIDGLQSGWTGEQAKTIVPDRATAWLDMRLVKNIQPDRQVERLREHIRAQGYTVVDHDPTSQERARFPRIARVESEGGYPAAGTSMDLPVSRALIRVVDEASAETLIKLPPLGGSVPMYIFEELGLPAITVPMVNFDDNQHGPNENLRIGNLWRGMQVYGALAATLDW